MKPLLHLALLAVFCLPASAQLTISQPGPVEKVSDSAEIRTSVTVTNTSAEPVNVERIRAGTGFSAQPLAQNPIPAGGSVRLDLAYRANDIHISLNNSLKNHPQALGFLWLDIAAPVRATAQLKFELTLPQVFVARSKIGLTWKENEARTTKSFVLESALAEPVTLEAVEVASEGYQASYVELEAGRRWRVDVTPGAGAEFRLRLVVRSRTRAYGVWENTIAGLVHGAPVRDRKPGS